MKTRCCFLAGLAFLLLTSAAFDPLFASGPFAGRPLFDVLEALRNEGAPLVYSSNLVSPGLLVESEPRAGTPMEIAREILLPHGLALAERDNLYVVVRSDDRSGRAIKTPGSKSGQSLADEAPQALETVTVSASRYVLQASSQFFIDQRAIQALPDLGEDPLRAVHRLPGTAASGLSSKSHFRGGEHNETAIYLNGLQLFEPFHIRDYHSIFSSIDARAVSGVEAYTGGFPVTFGEHMSGVLALETSVPDEARHTELGLSIYNTSVLHQGRTAEGDWDWLFSARESNLDLILDPDLGEPKYFDVFAQLEHRWSERTNVGLNAIYARDSVTVITESDPQELERSDSDTQNSQFWLRLDTEWRPDLASSTVFSYSAFDNLRIAQANDPDKMTARVRDDRDAEVLALKQDWLWSGWPRHQVRWGLDLRKQEARDDYSGSAIYNGLLAGLAGLENPREYMLKTTPKGTGLSLYLSDRWRWTDATWLEFGLRWDRQTWTEPQYSDQVSPRLSLLHQIDENTDLRFSWGSYQQSQAIQRMQVEDGVSRFFAPQRSDHYIAGYRRRFENGYRFRAEAFWKDYDRLKPRFENLFDSLALIPELAPDRVRLDPQSARARGLELSLEYRGAEDIEWWTVYTWSRVTDRIGGVNQPRSWDQRHSLQAGFSWTSGPWQTGIAINAHSGWPTTPLTVIPGSEEEELIPVPGDRNSANFKTFITLDFRISREFEVSKGRLSAFLEISNASNRDNPCCIDYDIDDEVDPPVVDRSEDYWVPIIPAIGVLWEF